MAVSGRKITLWETSGTPAEVGGGREHGITINSELLDITDKSSGGWRELLADVGVRSVDVAVSGVFDDASIIALAMGATSGMIGTYELRVEGFGVFAGNWGIESPEVTSPHDDVSELSFTLKSSGVITWTPA